MKYAILLFIIFFNLFVYKVYIGNSTIDGSAVFANRAFKKGDYLFDAGYFKNYKLIITKLGSFINHCNYPNINIDLEGNVCKIYADKNLEKDEELVLDYDKVKTRFHVIGSQPNWSCQVKNFVKK